MIRKEIVITNSLKFHRITHKLKPPYWGPSILFFKTLMSGGNFNPTMKSLAVLQSTITPHF